MVSALYLFFLVTMGARHTRALSAVRYRSVSLLNVNCMTYFKLIEFIFQNVTGSGETQKNSLLRRPGATSKQPDIFSCWKLPKHVRETLIQHCNVFR